MANLNGPDMYIKPNSFATTAEEEPIVSGSGSGETTRRNSGNNSNKEKEESATAVQVDDDGVNVERAKQDFEQLQRTYTQKSLQRSLSRRSTRGQEPQFDPEKGGDHGEEFDLLDFLVRYHSCPYYCCCTVRTLSDLLSWVATPCTDS